MLIDEPTFVPYAPGNKTVHVVQRIHQGTIPQTLNESALVSLGVAAGNADRVQKALRFLGLTDAEFHLTDLATKLRKATSDEYRPLLGQILKGAYEPVFVSYDPAIATGIELDNAFKPYDPAGQRPNMIALFMALCREAGLAPESAPRRGRPPAGTAKPKLAANGAAAKKAVIVPPMLPPSLGTSKKISLRSGGEIALIVSVDIMGLSSDDRDFVFRLVDQLKAYENEGPALQRPQPSLNP